MGKKKAASPKEGALYIKTGRPADRAKVDALCARMIRLPVLDRRTTDQILGYDAFGIPR
jgi:hypothetical protein